MLTDAASLGLAIFAAGVSRRTANDSHSYGYGRARVLGAFVNGVTLLLVSAWIIIEAAGRLNEPQQVLAGPMLLVATAGLLVNIVAYLILRDDKDINTCGALAHVVGDLLGSVAAMLAGGVILVTGWTPADPLLSVAVALLIVRSGWHITREAVHVLLEGNPCGFDAQAIEQSLTKAVPGVLDVHHLHLWLVGANEPHITLHVRVDNSLGADAAIAAITWHLTERFAIRHVTVQIERDGFATGTACKH